MCTMNYDFSLVLVTSVSFSFATGLPLSDSVFSSDCSTFQTLLASFALGFTVSSSVLASGCFPFKSSMASFTLANNTGSGALKTASSSSEGFETFSEILNELTFRSGEARFDVDLEGSGDKEPSQVEQ